MKIIVVIILKVIEQIQLHVIYFTFILFTFIAEEYKNGSSIPTSISMI